MKLYNRMKKHIFGTSLSHNFFKLLHMRVCKTKLLEVNQVEPNYQRLTRGLVLVSKMDTATLIQSSYIFRIILSTVVPYYIQMYQFLQRSGGIANQPHHGDKTLVLNLHKVLLPIWDVLLPRPFSQIFKITLVQPLAIMLQTGFFTSPRHGLQISVHYTARSTSSARSINSTGAIGALVL